mmetsp:Transcript_65404/g.202602  ORF Transcript_65404/g.202602 Transcript_65404/m.202602 type:complete len:224 (-) Transcript_65404:849-1520(-)
MRRPTGMMRMQYTAQNVRQPLAALVKTGGPRALKTANAVSKPVCSLDTSRRAFVRLEIAMGSVSAIVPSVLSIDSQTPAKASGMPSASSSARRRASASARMPASSSTCCCASTSATVGTALSTPCPEASSRAPARPSAARAAAFAPRSRASATSRSRISPAESPMDSAVRFATDRPSCLPNLLLWSASVTTWPTTSASGSASACPSGDSSAASMMCLSSSPAR